MKKEESKEKCPHTTKPEYLSDTYKFESTGKIIDIITLDKSTYQIILDNTIFHPQGGGQPSDKGFISFNSGGNTKGYGKKKW